MRKLCICIPTYNRPDCISFILKSYAVFLGEYEFDVFIHDTSESDETEAVVSRFKESYGSRLEYVRFREYPDMTTDLKVTECFRILQEAYEYVHLCGDGLVVDFPRYYPLFRAAADEGYDVIHFNNNLLEQVSRYTSGKDFARDCGWFATYYGATAVSSRLIRRADYESILGVLRNTGYVYWSCLMAGIGSDDEKIVCYNEFPMQNNPHKPTNSSYQPGKFIGFWVVGWNKAINELPSHYETVGPQVKKDVGDHLHLYGWENLIRLRKTDNLCWDVVRDKRELFEQVTDVPFWHVKLVALTPRPIIDGMVGLRGAASGIRSRLGVLRT